MVKKYFTAILFFGIFCAACHQKASNEQPVIQDSQKQLQGIITKYPDSFQSAENLIKIYSDSSQYDKALALTDKFIQQKDSLNDSLWYIRGFLYSENEDTVDAINSFEKAISIKPDPGYIKLLAGLYAQKKDPRALILADELANDPIAADPASADFIKGFYYSYAGDKTKAIGYFNKCIIADYTYVLAYREKAICLYDLQKYNDALEVLTKAIAVQSTYDEAYYWMGRCNEKLGNKDEAIRDYTMALQISSDYNEAATALKRLTTQ